MHKEIVTNAGLILTTANKHKNRDSSAYNIETHLMEYEAANEDLKTKIEERRLVENCRRQAWIYFGHSSVKRP